MDLSTRCTFHIIRHAQSLFLLSNLLCNTLGWIAKLIEQRGIAHAYQSRGPPSRLTLFSTAQNNIVGHRDILLTMHSAGTDQSNHTVILTRRSSPFCATQQKMGLVRTTSIESSCSHWPKLCWGLTLIHIMIVIFGSTDSNVLCCAMLATFYRERHWWICPLPTALGVAWRCVS